MHTTRCKHTLHGGIVLPTPQSFSASCLATHLHLSSPFNGVSALIIAISRLVDVSFLHYWWHRWHSIDTSLTASPLPHWVHKCVHACVCVCVRPIIASGKFTPSVRQYLIGCQLPANGLQSAAASCWLSSLLTLSISSVCLFLKLGVCLTPLWLLRYGWKMAFHTWNEVSNHSHQLSFILWIWLITRMGIDSKQ